MIYSMTAFARLQTQGEWGSLICEIRSINHRYLEVSTYLPDVLRGLEMPIRDSIRAMLRRGKIDCSFRYQASAGTNQEQIAINQCLAKALCKAGEEIRTFTEHAALINPTDILRFPQVIETKETDMAVLQPLVLDLLQKTLQDLVAVRSREGRELNQLFTQRLDAMQQELAKVKQKLPSVMSEQRERLLKRFQEVNIELDPSRLEQEMLIFAQKIDVAEEVDRTETHIAEVKRVLKEGGMVGRRLDFLLQELNREANTLGSKSTDTVLTLAAVELKVLIEQIREQVQNIE